MSDTFQRPETVVCSILVTNSAGTLTDPGSAMTITITDPAGAVVVNNVAMTRDSAGTYHYDFQPNSSAPLGRYLVKYTATDVTRVTIKTDSFVLEAA